jgi:hypothetical protein
MNPKELLMYKVILFPPKKPQAFFYLSPFVPLQGESFRVNPSPFYVADPARGGGKGEQKGASSLRS